MAGKKGNIRRTGIFWRYSHEELQEMKKMFLAGEERKVIAEKWKCHINTLPQLRSLLGLPPFQRNPIRSVYQIKEFSTNEVLMTVKGLKNLGDACCRSHQTIAKHLQGKAKSTSYKGRKVIVTKIKK